MFRYRISLNSRAVGRHHRSRSEVGDERYDERDADQSSLARLRSGLVMLVVPLFMSRFTLA